MEFEQRTENEFFVGFAIRAATACDGESLARIYNHYVLHTTVSFEEEPVPASEMARRLDEVQSASLPWLVAVQEDCVLGYAYGGRWKGRCAYRFTAEVGVYLDVAHAGRGIGSRLYGVLLPLLSSLDIHTALGAIALPNEASVAFHERHGFEKVAHLCEVGFKRGRWIDVGYWQRTL
jgi:phosphinothricin acetyltransferase